MSEQNLNPFAPPAAELDGPPAISAAGAVTLAERGTRFAAVCLDGLCLLPVMVLIFVMGFLAGTAKHAGEGGMPPVAIALGALAGLYGLGFIIFQIYLLTTRGQTLGKRWMKIRIVKLDGSAPGFVHAVLLRAMIGGIIGVIPYLGGIYGLVDALFIFRDDRRCVHDLIATTRVIKAG